MLRCSVTLEHHPASLNALSLWSFPPIGSIFQRSDHRSLPAVNVFRPPLCFHTLTNCFSRSSFTVTFLQTAGGCPPIIFQPGITWTQTPLESIVTGDSVGYRGQTKWNSFSARREYSIGCGTQRTSCERKSPVRRGLCVRVAFRGGAFAVRKSLPDDSAG